MADLMSVGLSGLMAAKAALTVAGDNIVNAEVDGYSRRTVELREAGLGGNLGLSSSKTALGTGVKVGALVRAQDSFLAATVRSTDSRSSELDALVREIGQVSDLLSDTDTSLLTPANTLFDAFNELALRPDTAAAREGVLNAARHFASSVRESARYLEAQRDNMLNLLDASMTVASNLADALAQVNKSLAAAGSGSSASVGLLDERDRLLADLAKEVRITVTERDNGVADVFLGESAMGRALVDGGRALALEARRVGGRIEFVLDPRGVPLVSGQVVGGAAAGLRTAHDMLGRSLDGVNTLVRSFAEAVNRIQTAGVTGEGLAGSPLFSLEYIAVEPSGANLGAARVAVTLEAPDMARYQRLRLRYGDDGVPRLEELSGALLARGYDDIRQFGLRLVVEGSPRAGDAYTLDLVTGAAKSLAVALVAPSALATGKRMLIDVDPSNEGTAVLRVGEPVAALTQPAALETVFTNGLGSDRLVRPLRPAALATIPAGVDDLSLRSLDVPDLATVSLAAADLASLAAVRVQLADGRSATADLTRLDRGSLSGLVGSLMRDPGFEALGLAVQRKGDALQIVGPGAGSLGEVSLLRADQTLLSNPVALVAGQRGEPLRLFTRDGVQVSGPALTADAAAALLTVANGFAPEARYVPPGVNADYRGLELFALSYRDGLVADATTSNGVAALQLPLDWARHGAAALQVDEGRAQPGRTAVLTLETPDGRVLSAVPAPARLNTGDPVAAAGAMADALNALGPAASLIGEPIPALSDPAAAPWSLADTVTRFRVRHGARDFTVELTAAHSAGQLGTVDIRILADDGLAHGLTAGVTSDGRLMLRSPPALGGERLALLDGTPADSLAALGLGTGAAAALRGNRVVQLPAAGDFFDLALGGQSYRFTQGSGLALQVTDGNGAVVSDFSAAFVEVSDAYQLTVRTPAALAADTVAVAGGAAFGLTTLAGFAATPSEDGENLGLQAAAGAQALRATLRFTAPVSDEVRLVGPLPEDLLLVSTAPSGAGFAAEWRTIDAGFIPPPASVRIEVSQPDPAAPGLLLRFLDEASGAVVAERATTQLGGSYVVDGRRFEFIGGLSGGLNPGDVFRVEFDRARPGDNRNAADLAALATNSLFAGGGGSFLELLNVELTALASEVRITKTAQTAANLMLTEVRAKHVARTGVNLDQEAGELVRYQQSYQAAAQVINTAKVLFETILQLR